MDSLIERIRARIADGRPNDHPDEWLSVQPPVASDAVAAAEVQLGFRLPELLRQLYTRVGNGGFGPVFGLIPLSGFSAGQAEFDLVGDYLRLVRRFAEWPVGLVPVFYCGCTLFEFVDCRTLGGAVTWFDEGTETIHELLRTNRSSIPSLERRLELWLAGEEPW